MKGTMALVDDKDNNHNADFTLRLELSWDKHFSLCWLLPFEIYAFGPDPIGRECRIERRDARELWKRFDVWANSTHPFYIRNVDVAPMFSMFHHFTIATRTSLLHSGRLTISLCRSELLVAITRVRRAIHFDDNLQLFGK